MTTPESLHLEGSDSKMIDKGKFTTEVNNKLNEYDDWLIDLVHIINQKLSNGQFDLDTITHAAIITIYYVDLMMDSNDLSNRHFIKYAITKISESGFNIEVSNPIDLDTEMERYIISLSLKEDN